MALNEQAQASDNVAKLQEIYEPGFMRTANTSGVIPLDLRVLVRPDAAEAVTRGGIILPEPEVDKQKYAQCKATIIAVGENAFEEAAARSPAFAKPKAGDRVLIAKYHGVMITGDDGVDYRLLNDEDVTARLEES